MLLACKQPCLSQLGYVKHTKHGLLLSNTCIYTANILWTHWHNVRLSGVVALMQLRGYSQADGDTATAGLCKR